MAAVVASQIDPATGITFDLAGFGLALLAAASQAVYVIISRTGYRAVPADQAMGAILLVTASASSAAAILAGSAGALLFPIEQPDILPLLAFTGLFAAAIPSMLFLTGIRRIGGTAAGILMLFEPVVGVILAAALLAESIVPIQVLGGAAILAAAVILQRATPTGERAVAAPAVEAET
jgi:drug/metabolite transporter (DMT)-like permease